MPDGSISATEADRNFSKVLRDVEGGERVTITKDGKPVAVLSPTSFCTRPTTPGTVKSTNGRRTFSTVSAPPDAACWRFRR